jgi:hypothetical protein
MLRFEAILRVILGVFSVVGQRSARKEFPGNNSRIELLNRRKHTPTNKKMAGRAINCFC